MSGKNKKETRANGIDDETNVEETELIVPPDGGWGWVVMIASFCCTTMVDGIVNAVGIVLIPMGESFNESKTKMAFVSSFLAGFYLIAGPFVSALANKFGFRKVTIAGSILASFCFAISYFATDVYFVYFVYSIIGGIGLSMIYIPAVVIVGFYFEKWRALATGIAMCGSGVGTFIFPPITSALVNNFGWRGTLIGNAVFILMCAGFGFLFRPLKPVRVKVTDSDKNDNKEIELVEKKNNSFKVEKQAGSGVVYIPADMDDKSSPHTWMGVAPNDTYPTAAEVFRKSHTNLEMRRSSATGSATKPTQGNGNPQTGKYIVVSVKEGDENQEETGNGKNENTVPLLPGTTKIITSESSKVVERRNTLSNVLANESQISRPMYREDIFFGGSLNKIPQYQSLKKLSTHPSKASIAYHLSVTHLPTVTDVNEETDAQCNICPEAFRRTLVTMLDFSLLKSPTFLLVAFSGFFSMLGFYAPFLYLPARGEQGGMDPAYAKWLISVIGVANTAGRILCGAISSMEGVNSLWINNIAITIGGIATMMSAISYSVGYQYTYCVIFGLSIAAFASLRSIIVVEFMGLEKLTNAFGLLMMFQGISTIMGAPIAGALRDMSNSFDLSFYVAGGFYTFSALLTYPLYVVSQREKRRSNQKSIEI